MSGDEDDFIDDPSFYGIPDDDDAEPSLHCRLTGPSDNLEGAISPCMAARIQREGDGVVTARFGKLQAGRKETKRKGNVREAYFVYGGRQQAHLAYRAHFSLGVRTIESGAIKDMPEITHPVICKQEYHLMLIPPLSVARSSSHRLDQRHLYDAWYLYDA
eukprot:scaffold47535_cov18-Tisochrysis_lutea.AAC.3